MVDTLGGKKICVSLKVFFAKQLKAQASFRAAKSWQQDPLRHEEAKGTQGNKAFSGLCLS